MNNYGNLGLNNRILNAYKKKLGTKQLVFPKKHKKLIITKAEIKKMEYESLIKKADELMDEDSWKDTFNKGAVREIIDSVKLLYLCEKGKAINDDETLELIINPCSDWYYENPKSPIYWNGSNKDFWVPYHDKGWKEIEDYIKAKEKREEAKKYLV